MDIEAKSGELVTVLGPNGCGKSTLIKTLCGVLKPKAGRIFIDDREVSEIDKKERSRLVSYVPQDFAKGEYTTVYDAVLIGRRPYIDWTYSKQDIEICADAIMKMKVEPYIDRFVNELSGGQLQRVIIARSLAQDPQFYIFDEPTSSFDLRNQLDLMRIMKGIIKEKNACLLVALHDINLALRYSDRVIVMKDGVIYKEGTPEEVITPKTISEVYGVDAEIVTTPKGRFIHAFDNDADEMLDRY